MQITTNSIVRLFLGFCVILEISGLTVAADIWELNKLLGRGVNFGNFLEPPRNANWSIPLNESHFALVKQAGFDSVRLPVKWSDYAQATAPYTIEPDFFQRIDRLLAAAEASKLRLVLNVHHYDGLDSEPDKHVERFVGLWQQIATRYRDRGDWLYFELDNEPHSKLDPQWNEVLRKGLAAVRQSNPVRPVIVGPPSWNGIWALPKLDLPDDRNLIVTVHMYNPFEFTHQGASWADAKVRSVKDKTFGTAEEIAKVKQELDQAAKWSKEHNRPIYVGEFGAFQNAPLSSRVVWTQAVARHCEQAGMSWAYWELAAGFGIYDLESKQWRKELVEALIPKVR